MQQLRNDITLMSVSLRTARQNYVTSNTPQNLVYHPAREITMSLSTHHNETLGRVMLECSANL